MDKGIILAGEAAQAYVTFKYVELAVVVFILVAAALGVVAFIRYTDK